MSGQCVLATQTTHNKSVKAGTALQESRLAEDGMRWAKIYTFFWQDHTESPDYTI